MGVECDAAVSAFIEQYPSFSVSHRGGKGFRIDGPFLLDAEYEDARIIEDFRLRIVVPFDFPACIPTVLEISNVIPHDYEHLYDDQSFCLGIYGEIAMRLAGDPSLIAFVEGPVTSFLYTAVFYLKYGRYPYGDRAHGVKGIYQYYAELFSVETELAACSLLAHLYRGEQNDLLPCPCGSGIATRKCHGSQLKKIASGPEFKWVIHDCETILRSCLKGQEPVTCSPEGSTCA